MTNLEKVRKMSAEDLVELFDKIYNSEYCPCCNGDCDSHETCKDCYIKWLLADSDVN